MKTVQFVDGLANIGVGLIRKRMRMVTPCAFQRYPESRCKMSVQGAPRTGMRLDLECDDIVVWPRLYHSRLDPIDHFYPREIIEVRNGRWDRDESDTGAARRQYHRTPDQ